LAVPSFADDEASIGELRARVDRTVAFLKSVDPNKFKDSETRPVQPTFRNLKGTFSGKTYAFHVLLPNFFSTLQRLTPSFATTVFH
jgi:hypothetical protein